MLVMQQYKDQEEEDKIRKAIIEFKSNSFLFEESKNYEWRSPLYKEYKALFFIDKIEFYVNEEFLAKMEY